MGTDIILGRVTSLVAVAFISWGKVGGEGVRGAVDIGSKSGNWGNKDN